MDERIGKDILVGFHVAHAFGSSPYRAQSDCKAFCKASNRDDIAADYGEVNIASLPAIATYTAAEQNDLFHSMPLRLLFSIRARRLCPRHDANAHSIGSRNPQCQTCTEARSRRMHEPIVLGSRPCPQRQDRYPKPPDGRRVLSIQRASLQQHFLRFCSALKNSSSSCRSLPYALLNPHIPLQSFRSVPDSFLIASMLDATDASIASSMAYRLRYVARFRVGISASVFRASVSGSS